MGVAQSRKAARAGGWGGGQGPAHTTLGPVLLVAVDEQEAGALRAEGKQDALHQGWDEDDAQQQGPQVLVAHDGVQAEHLAEAGMEEAAPGTPALATPTPSPAPAHGLCPLCRGAAGQARRGSSEPQFPQSSHREKQDLPHSTSGRTHVARVSHRAWGLWGLGRGKPSGEKVVSM